MNYIKFIFDKIPNIEMTQLEIARFLYIELGKIVSFSTTFNNTTDKNYAKMYFEKVDATKYKKTQINCNLWAQLYSQLLTYAGIKNEIINQGHKHVQFYIEKEKWIADATHGHYNDLARIQNGDITCYFGPALIQDMDKADNNVTINEDTQQQIDEIDKKIGYNMRIEKLKKLQEQLQELKEGNKSIYEILNIQETKEKDELTLKLEFLFSSIKDLSIGYYESKDFVYNLEKIMLTDEELQRVGAVELKRTNINKEVDIIQLIYVEVNGNYEYYLLCPTIPISKIDEKNIIALATIGYGIDNKKIPGIDFPNKFKKAKRTIGIKYILHKINPNQNKIINKYDFNQHERQRQRR